MQIFNFKGCVVPSDEEAEKKVVAAFRKAGDSFSLSFAMSGGRRYFSLAMDEDDVDMDELRAALSSLTEEIGDIVEFFDASWVQKDTDSGEFRKALCLFDGIRTVPLEPLFDMEYEDLADIVRNQGGSEDYVAF